MSHISDTVRNCSVLLERYSWMAAKGTPVAFKSMSDTPRRSTAARPVTDAERATIIEMHRAKKPFKEIGEATGRSYPVIRRVLLRAGIIPQLAASYVKNCKPSDIEKLWRSGLKPSEIMLKLNLSRQQVNEHLIGLGAKVRSYR